MQSMIMIKSGAPRMEKSKVLREQTRAHNCLKNIDKLLISCLVRLRLVAPR